LGVPTKPNTTGKATASDVVMTPPSVARWIVSQFPVSGKSLDPCAGDNAFFNALPEPKERCEISDGLDFFEYTGKVDWIITNPPYSIYDRILEHCFNTADNVVLFVPVAKAFKSMKTERMVEHYGGLKEIIFMGSGGKYGFGFGFPVGCLYYKRGYTGDCRIRRITTAST